MRERTLFRGFAVTIVLFVSMLMLLIAGISQIDTRSKAEQAASLKAAVLRATITCYAVEGRYPPDAAYLQAHYGLTYDRQRFIVSIHTFAENLLPDISVLAEGEV